VEIERAILPLFDYFDANLQTLNTYLSDSAKEMVMTRVWKEILLVIEGLLIPPLSEVYSEMKPLSDKEVDIVFKWLKVFSFFFPLCSWWKNIEMVYIVVPSGLLLCQRGRSGTIGSSTESKIPRCRFDTVVL
jgi:hypothetical protein